MARSQQVINSYDRVRLRVRSGQTQGRREQTVKARCRTPPPQVLLHAPQPGPGGGRVRHYAPISI
jgi:hypothetical protein